MKTIQSPIREPFLQQQDGALPGTRRPQELRSLVTLLYRLTGGRFTPLNRDVLLLTTRGRKHCGVRGG
jgi:hypothetical protein